MKIDEFTLFFNYCRGLQFDEKPNYLYLKSLLKSISVKYAFLINNQFDWQSDGTCIVLKSF
jgi:casein kinase 1